MKLHPCDFFQTLDKPIPDRTAIINFRHLLEKHHLVGKVVNFIEINDWLTDSGTILKEGGLVDETIIEAPTLTKNNGKQCDLDMHQTEKSDFLMELLIIKLPDYRYRQRHRASTFHKL
nr:hypothetical protein [synthetic construct]